MKWCANFKKIVMNFISILLFIIFICKFEYLFFILYCLIT